MSIKNTNLGICFAGELSIWPSPGGTLAGEDLCERSLKLVLSEKVKAIRRELEKVEHFRILKKDPRPRPKISQISILKTIRILNHNVMIQELIIKLNVYY